MTTQDIIILKVVRIDKGIVYGARSIKKQIGMFGRSTYDWDVFFNKPKSSANKTEKLLDKTFGDVYYVAMLKHKDKKGISWRVKHIGRDKIPKTQDDYVVADYTKMPIPIPKYITIHNIKYRVLSAELQKKIETLKTKSKKFRHQKDLIDVQRIKTTQRLRKWKLI